MNFEIAQGYVQALTGDINTVLDWRCIHDTRKDQAAHNFTGNLSEVWAKLLKYNSEGWGVFVNINALDGKGKELSNVQYIRTHVIDLDNVLTARTSFDKALNNQPAPTFACETSPGKFHVYWVVEPYVSNDFYTLHQRKFRQLYDSDKSIIDPTRVLRVPGFYHLKNPQQPYLVHWWSLPGYGKKILASEIQAALASVNVIDGGSSRHKLGEKEMAAPSLDWLKRALDLINPNDLDRAEWISFSAAVKQAGWSLADEGTLYKIWADWCLQYKDNDIGENLKNWNSIRDTEVGWTSIQRRTPIKVYQIFGENKQVLLPPPIQEHIENKSEFKEIVTPEECKRYFKNCYFIGQMGKIFSNGRYMNATQFNGWYGGKHFIITNTGKTTDEACKAALRSTEWTIPKVDHIRFLPNKEQFDMIEDEFGRMGLNTYIKPTIHSKQGNIDLFFLHMQKILPNERDRSIFYEYLAHSVKFPGYKIPWSILLQSTEGIGKTVFLELLSHSLGLSYVYSPPAPELVASGTKFNAWMRNKLMIIVNEIKVDERRELIEILKPMITDARVQIQGKGADQDMEDNVANWLFFSNYKDAIPLHKNGRRYSIFYSALQSANDLINAGMDTPYFNKLWHWLRKEGGFEAITYWLLNYPIEMGSLPQRAPETSSYFEALKIGRSPAEVVVAECVEDQLPGFRGGYISTAAAMGKIKASGIRNPTLRTIQTVLENMGYIAIGKATRTYMQEDLNNRATIYAMTSNMHIEDYGRVQGYE